MRLFFETIVAIGFASQCDKILLHESNKCKRGRVTEKVHIKNKQKSKKNGRIVLQSSGL
jgi:hypothetical protein